MAIEIITKEGLQPFKPELLNNLRQLFKANAKGLAKQWFNLRCLN
jgi:hypothetical protein